MSPRLQLTNNKKAELLKISLNLKKGTRRLCSSNATISVFYLENHPRNLRFPPNRLKRYYRRVASQQIRTKRLEYQNIYINVKRPT